MYQRCCALHTTQFSADKVHKFSSSVTLEERTFETNIHKIVKSIQEVTVILPIKEELLATHIAFFCAKLKKHAGFTHYFKYI